MGKLAYCGRGNLIGWLNPRIATSRLTRNEIFHLRFRDLCLFFSKVSSAEWTFPFLRVFFLPSTETGGKVNQGTSEAVGRPAQATPGVSAAQHRPSRLFLLTRQEEGQEEAGLPQPQVTVVCRVAGHSRYRDSCEQLSSASQKHYGSKGTKPSVVYQFVWIVGLSRCLFIYPAFVCELVDPDGSWGVM